MFTRSPLYLLLGAATLISASPALSRRQGDIVLSPDNTCGSVVGGAGNNYHCGSSNLGPCCSQYVSPIHLQSRTAPGESAVSISSSSLMRS